MEKFHMYHKRGSTFTGAIFMTNRKTKQECLQRKLFGLPLSMAWFIKKVKAGMLLFLFEHEERKLYGVFEATSDGAMNIIPNAYISSGKSYPAQILFKRVWMCKPLCEDEFHDAIKDNYYAPYKFYFGLSYEQVVKLVHLFSLKRINVMQHASRGITHQIIKQFEECSGNRLTGPGLSLRFGSDGYNTNDGTRQLHMSHIPPNTSQYPPPNFVGPSLPICNPSNVCLPSQKSCEFQPNFHDYGHIFNTERYDPSNLSISLSPGMTVTTDVESLQTVCSLGQPSGSLRPPSDFIPLVGTNCSNENVESSHVNSTQKCKSGSESAEDDDSEDMEPYTIAAKSRLRSDTEHSRTSVFSRLAKTPESCRLFKTKKAGVKNKRAAKLVSIPPKKSSLSLDEVLSVLSQRREQFIAMTKAPKLSIQQDGDAEKKSEGTVEMEQRNAISLGELEFSNDIFAGDVIANDEIAEADNEELFLNFKRKTERGKWSGEHETNSDAESSPTAEMLQKRRKLLRPSFSEEECQNDRSMCQKIVEFVNVVENSSNNIGILNHLDTDNKNNIISDSSLDDSTLNGTENSFEELQNCQLISDSVNSSASEACPGDVAFGKTEENDESSRKRRKEVSNRNLRWFLLKSIDNHNKA